VYADAVTDRAAAIICAHNHPSGNVTPSTDDRAVTRSLVEAGDVLGIRLLDHVVFSARGFYSFLDQGELG
jgi:DNA repair protein RadC